MLTPAVYGPYREPDSTTPKWVTLFVILSLLAHALIILVILLITHFMPVPKIEIPKVDNVTTLTLLPEPDAPKPKPIFIPTQPQANAKHKEQQVESANDAELTSKSQKARAPDSIMPDVEGKKHNPDLNNTPNVQAPPKLQPSMTPPTPRPAEPQKPTPPQPQPDKAQQVPTQPPKPAPKPLPPKPPTKAPPAVDPLTGLPVLPPINAPTLAPPDSAAPPLAPAPSLAQQAASVHGALGHSGDNSPAAMATDLGKYKQYIYSVVGSHWYPDINQHFGTIGVGMVHIQFTIHSDGTLSDVTVLEGENLMILRDISLSSLRSGAPFKPFSDAMIKQVGDSYTDDFTFSVY